MCSTYNKNNSVVAERFIRNLESKIYKRMTANNRKSYPGYLTKIIDQCNNTYHCSIRKKSIDADYSDLSEEINLKVVSQDY